MHTCDINADLASCREWSKASALAFSDRITSSAKLGAACAVAKLCLDVRGVSPQGPTPRLAISWTGRVAITTNGIIHVPAHNTPIGLGGASHGQIHGGFFEFSSRSEAPSQS
jgi:hypothetical protein